MATAHRSLFLLHLALLAFLLAAAPPADAWTGEIRGRVVCDVCADSAIGPEDHVLEGESEVYSPKPCGQGETLEVLDKAENGCYGSKSPCFSAGVSEEYSPKPCGQGAACMLAAASPVTPLDVGGLYMDRLGNPIIQQASQGGMGDNAVDFARTRPSEREIMAFGGMRELEVRSSQRLLEQGNADLPQLERAMDRASQKMYDIPRGYSQGFVLDSSLVSPASWGSAWPYGCRMHTHNAYHTGYLHAGWMVAT